MFNRNEGKARSQADSASISQDAFPHTDLARTVTRLKASLAIALAFLLLAIGGAGFLAYNVYYLNSAYSESQDKLAARVSDYSKLIDNVEELSTALGQARDEIEGLRQENSETVNEYNEAIERADSYLASLDIANQTIDAQRTEMDETNRVTAQKDVQLAHYRNANVGLQDSVSELETSVGQLETANDNLTRTNGSLAREKNALASRVRSIETQLARYKASQVETRAVQMRYSGTVNLRINRSGELGSDRTMDILEHSVRTIENYMGEPIPLEGDEIRLDFVDKINIREAAGVYKGTHMEILARYDAEEPRWGDDYLGIIIAHEVAHYYFNGEQNWLEEGAAEFLAIYSEYKRVGRNISSQERTCTHVTTIRDLERGKFEQSDDGFTCNYTLGEGLFLELYSHLGEADFRQAFRDLHRESNNRIAGVYQVRQAFSPRSERVQKIIDRWYGYRNTPEAHWPDGSFLAYYTWQKDGGWWHKSQNGKPCALRITYEEAIPRFRHHSFSLCQLTGEWDENDDLIVNVHGRFYRAVEIEISKDPDEFHPLGEVNYLR